ncbi:MAG: glycoside hydrolase family 13 protein [Lachnospiraceae bacterium]|nr:glycoside hydrolase family 13 protein [Lachnospiraceae bacterium]
MKKEAVYHNGTEEFVYPISRNQLIFRIRTARKEIAKCQIIYWNRDDNKIKKQDMECFARDELFDHFQCRIDFTRVARYQRYYFILEETNGEEWYFSAYGVSQTPPDSGFFEYLYANGNDVVTAPDWAKGVVYYQIFPERFCDGGRKEKTVDFESWGSRPTRENYMGGNLEGIRTKIPYLKELGVECLYLNPVFAGDFNHKYATTDYFRIDPLFGTNEEFREFVRQCHEQNIRVVLDGVFNHTGVHFPYFQDILEKQEESAYKNWFLIEKYPAAVTDADAAYECVGAYPYMPKLNTADVEVREYIIKIMDHWLGEYQIDGWRLDVADEVDSTVWEMARLVLKEKYPACILIGETWGYGGRMLRGDQLDSVMNYLFRDAVWDYFGKKSISAETFDSRINKIVAGYKSETCHLLYNLIDSHDTERFLYICGGSLEILKLAAAFQMFFIGSPAVYYGDEVGITGQNDPDCRKCMIWDEQADQELLQWYKKLIFLRKTHVCIRKGRYRTILADDQNDTFAFCRIYEEKGSAKVIYMIFNNNSEHNKVLCPVLDQGEYIDLLSDTGAVYTAGSLEGRFYNQDITAYQAAVTVEMQPYAVKAIMKKEET